MKCDLCKRDVATDKLLCGTCAEAIRRLVVITQGPSEAEPASRQLTAHAGGRL